MLLQVSCVESLAEMGADGLISGAFYTQSNGETPSNADQERLAKTLLRCRFAIS